MPEITLNHGDARATIAVVGAEARSWRIAGRDLLWPGDPSIWSDISPILYPVVGWTRDGARVERRFAVRRGGARWSHGWRGERRHSIPEGCLTLGTPAKKARMEK